MVSVALLLTISWFGRVYELQTRQQSAAIACVVHLVRRLPLNWNSCSGLAACRYLYTISYSGVYVMILVLDAEDSAPKQHVLLSIEVPDRPTTCVHAAAACVR